MLNMTKSYIVIIFLLSAILLSFPFSSIKYRGTNFISHLEMPSQISGLVGQDVKEALDLNSEDAKYDFISETLAYEYKDKEGNKLIFIILNAADFHHPHVCFTGAGFKIKELRDTEFNIPGSSFKAHTLFTERGEESFLSLYWISIDKKIIHDWIEQKVKQLYFSMFNRKRVGLMIRIDIPVKKENINDALALSRQFVSDLASSLPYEKAEYIFGKK